jgi:hypothetical protein
LPPSPRTHLIIEHLFESPVVTITSIRDRCQVRYNTAKADIDRLVAAKILQPIAGSRPQAFYCAEIMQVAYGDGNTPANSARPGGDMHLTTP